MSNVKIKTLVSKMLSGMTLIEAVHEIDSITDEETKENVVSEIWRQYHEMCSRGCVSV